MSKRFSIVIILLVLKASFFGDHFKGNTIQKWVVEKKSTLNIQGATNVNNFQCDVTEYLRADTFFYTNNDESGKLTFTNSSLTVDIKRFDCHSKLITSDFKNTLQVDKNSTFKITFQSLDQFTNPCDNQVINGIVDVGLTGIIKRTEISYIINTLPGNRITLTGSHIFYFSDFNLKAPRKLGGLIRTKDQIKVNFRLFFKTI
jgi:hypothetical protein